MFTNDSKTQHANQLIIYIKKKLLTAGDDTIMMQFQINKFQ